MTSRYNKNNHKEILIIIIIKVIFYMLLMSDRYDFRIDKGLLYYMRTGELFGELIIKRA